MKQNAFDCITFTITFFFTKQCGVFSVTVFLMMITQLRFRFSCSQTVPACIPSQPHRTTLTTRKHTTEHRQGHSAGFITASFTHQMCEPLTVCPPAFSLSLTPLFWTSLHCSILSFYLSPISPHPIRHSASIAPWEVEDGPSCCAQACLSEVNVYVCVCAHMRA